MRPDGPEGPSCSRVLHGYAAEGRGWGLLLRLLGDHGLRGEEQGHDRGGVLQASLWSLYPVRVEFRGAKEELPHAAGDFGGPAACLVCRGGSFGLPDSAHRNGGVLIDWLQ